MRKLSVLYVSGSLGLGHITRDIAIANELRKLNPEAEIEWLAASPASDFLLKAGERLVPGAERYANENESAEKASRGSSLNLLSYLLKSRGQWKKNADLFLELISAKKYDLVIGDETYEINLALREHKEIKTFPFVMIFDFVGLEAMTKNPLEQLGVYYWNRIWSHDYRLKIKPPYDLALFVGEEQDVPETAFGFRLPQRRELARALYTFIGYVFPFDTKAYTDKKEIRRKLGYDDNPLVICSIGGTSIGKELLELCGVACSIAREKIPDLHTVFIAGPRLPIHSISVPDFVELKGYVPRLYEHFAASDLAVIQGGATSAFELAVMRRPFLYFPLEGHCEQENVARILTMRGAGVRMRLSQTTPESLAQKITSHIGTPVNYPEIPSDGAAKAAQAIMELLERDNQIS